MYLFSRRATLTGSERRSMTWAAEVSVYVDAHSSHTLTAWRADFGYPVGTVIWSAWVDSLEAMNAGFAALAEDDGYEAMTDKGLEFMTSGAEDELRQAIHGGPGDAPPPIGAVTTVTTAVMAGGSYSDAATWGVEMAQLVEEVTGLPTLFLVDSYGTFGQVTWLSGAPDLATADSSTETINAHSEYLKRLEAAGDLFLPGSGVRGLVSRIA
jgi:hypothetical protein